MFLSARHRHYPVAAREIMDRTEGKVANILVTGNMGELVRALESGRERLLAARQQIEDGIVTPQPVVISEEPHAESMEDTKVKGS